jgi:hypothetical protein
MSLPAPLGRFIEQAVHKVGAFGEWDTGHGGALGNALPPGPLAYLPVVICSQPT